MKACKYLILLAVLLFVGAEANAQGGLLGKLKDKAVDKVKEAVDKKSKKNKDKSEESAEEAEPQQDNKQEANKRKSGEGEYNKSDFVPGSVVIFEDALQGEQMGEFPSKWDVDQGTAEVAKMNSQMAIRLMNDNAIIKPLVRENPKNYLPKVFTLEFDYWCNGEEDYNAGYILRMHNGDNMCWDINIDTEGSIRWAIQKGTSDEDVLGDFTTAGVENLDSWNHFALSFNERALKIYINGTRVCNLPNARAPHWFSIGGHSWEDHRDLITNIRLAKGGVELYNRDAQSMTAVERAIAETGKFVTNNILFDTGKATLKPESLEEIQKVADYMKKNPTARFEVQGHTDNQGSDKVNDPLSQQRAEAIVQALVSMGCDEFNLRAVGKGSHNPVASNATPEGRAQNRRVEFIKK